MSDELTGGSDGIIPGSISGNEHTFAPEKEKRMAEVAEESEMPHALVKKFKGFSAKVEEIKNGGNFDDIKGEMEVELVEGKYPIKREMLESWIDQIHPELNDEGGKDLKEKFLGLTKPMTDDEKIVPDGPEVAAMEEQKHEILMQADTAYKDELELIEGAGLDEESKVAAQARAATMFGRIHELFKPGEDGRVWAKRAGKGLGYVALAIAIALLGYMKAIHSMTKRR